MTKPPILFLDVDGVLNAWGTSNNGLDADKVAILQQIVAATGCHLVISSSWRRVPRLMTRLHLMAESIGAKIIGTTPINDTRTPGGLSYGSTRGSEIDAWLQAHPDHGRFLILDDDDETDPHRTHHLQTDSYVGLTPSFATAAIRALKGECKSVHGKSRES